MAIGRFTCPMTGILLLITSCSVGPNYVKPEVAVPASYKELDGWKQAEPKDHIARGTWWKIYHDPVLNQLEEELNRSNQSIAQAEAQFRQSRALVRAARAGYFPTVTADASAARTRRTLTGSAGTISGTSGTAAAGGTGISGATASASTLNEYSVALDATWELDLWGRVRRTVEANTAGSQASEADLESIRLSMQSSLAQDYFQVRTLDVQKRILDETIAAYRKSLELTQNRYAAGVASRSDTLQAETQLKTTQAQYIDLDVQRSQLEHAIGVLLGKSPSVFILSQAPLTALPPDIPIGLPSDLLERRPDIAAAERRVAAANAEIGVATAAYFPTLTLTASGGATNSSFTKLFTLPSRFWSVGPQLSEILFNGGLRRAQTEQARAAYDANVAAYRQTVLSGFQEVEDNLAALRILEQEAQAQNDAVAAARESLAVVNNQYRAGIVSYLNVIVSQTSALANERTAADILGRRLTASVLLIRALGGGWNADGGATEGTASRPAGADVSPRK